MDSGTTGTLLCDRHEIWITNSEWIRFSIPNKTRMPEYCPPTHACNTHAPGWLYGSHPAVEDGAVQMRACFHWNSHCCYWRYPISVRNCTNFYVYQLSRIYACQLRLCVGKLCQGLVKEAQIASLILGASSLICSHCWWYFYIFFLHSFPNFSLDWKDISNCWDSDYHISKHVGVLVKFSAAIHIFRSLLGVANLIKYYLSWLIYYLGKV